MKYYYPDDDEQKEVTVQNVPLIVLELILLIISLFSFVAPIMISLFKMENLNVLLVMWVLILLSGCLEQAASINKAQHILTKCFILSLPMFFVMIFYD